MFHFLSKKICCFLYILLLYLIQLNLVNILGWEQIMKKRKFIQKRCKIQKMSLSFEFQKYWSKHRIYVSKEICRNIIISHVFFLFQLKYSKDFLYENTKKLENVKIFKIQWHRFLSFFTPQWLAKEISNFQLAIFYKHGKCCKIM